MYENALEKSEGSENKTCLKQRLQDFEISDKSYVFDSRILKFCCYCLFSSFHTQIIGSALMKPVLASISKEINSAR